MSSNENVVLSIKNLTKTYKDQISGEELTILKDLSVDFLAGSKNIIIGESGCGKSTLLNIVGALDSITSGSVVAGKYNISELNEQGLEEYRSKYLGLIFQFHYLLKDFTALENVFLPAYMTGLSKKQAMDKAKQLLVDVGMEHRMDHIPAKLSGGERQRVAVARSLINDPSLILADEPTGNLDPANSKLISELLFSVVDKYNKTLILVTHDREIAKKGENCFKLVDGHLELV